MNGLRAMDFARAQALMLVCLLSVAGVSAQTTLPVNLGVVAPEYSASDFTVSWSSGAYPDDIPAGTGLISPYWQLMSNTLYHRVNDGEFVEVLNHTGTQAAISSPPSGVHAFYLERQQRICGEEVPPGGGVQIVCQPSVTYTGFAKTVEVNDQGTIPVNLNVTRGASSDTFTISWDPVYDNSKYILREGRVGYTSTGETVVVDWKKLQKGGVQYTATNRSGGRYFYQLAERRFILNPNALVVSFPARSAEYPVNFIVAPELNAPGSSIDGNYTVSWHEAGVLDSVTVMERYDSAGNWLAQNPMRFNMLSAPSI